MSEQSQVVPEGAVEAGLKAAASDSDARLPRYKVVEKILAAALPHLLAANPAQAVGAQVGVPDGWRLAPTMATEEMILEAHHNSGVYGLDDESVADIWEAMLSAAPKPAAEGVKPDETNGWRPIDTAPKDGQPLLVADGGPFAYIAEYRQGGWVDMTGRPWAPTHWQALPEPPTCA
jgi:hypothetical protein